MENTIEKKVGSNVRMMKVDMTKEGRSLGHAFEKNKIFQLKICLSIELYGWPIYKPWSKNKVQVKNLKENKGKKLEN